MTLVGWVTGVGHLLGVIGVSPRLSALIAGSSLLFLQALHQLGERFEPPLVITFIISVVPIH